jgi:hypothetical protein
MNSGSGKMGKRAKRRNRSASKGGTMVKRGGLKHTRTMKDIYRLLTKIEDM